MIAVDTNVIIRFLVKDDASQASQVLDRFKQAENRKETFFVTLLVVLEVIWVLDSAYGYSREEILSAMDSLTRLTVFTFEHIDLIHDFLSLSRKSDHDLSDMLIGLCARHNGCDHTITFDKKASQTSLFKMVH